ncbi:MAG TPA: hypothetical protein EYQ21_02660 [Flavobacteriales bacterium]|jgi:hypothetical protein|nr:hypothetical protein [Flavobacteriales bacterium]
MQVIKLKEAYQELSDALATRDEQEVYDAALWAAQKLANTTKPDVFAVYEDLARSLAAIDVEETYEAAMHAVKVLSRHI